MAITLGQYEQWGYNLIFIMGPLLCTIYPPGGIRAGSEPIDTRLVKYGNNLIVGVMTIISSTN